MNIIMEDNRKKIYEKFFRSQVGQLWRCFPLPVHAINIKIVLTSRRDRGSKGKASPRMGQNMCQLGNLFCGFARSTQSKAKAEFQLRLKVCSAPAHMHAHPRYIYQYTESQWFGVDAHLCRGLCRWRGVSGGGCEGDCLLRIFKYNFAANLVHI